MGHVNCIQHPADCEVPCLRHEDVGQQQLTFTWPSTVSLTVRFCFQSYGPPLTLALAWIRGKLGSSRACHASTLSANRVMEFLLTL
eukprot:scaffold152015_cov20-Tisochrysis_lutea.AAC.1